MKKKIISVMLLVCMLLTLPVLASAAGSDAVAAADHLHALGLLQGYGTDAEGNVDYRLERVPNRAEALVMLIRLLGEEEAALECTAETPFTDMETHWAKSYVAYAYEKGYTNGTSATTFSPAREAEARMYLTFVLRALGYKDGEDFEYRTAWEKTDELGVTAGEYNADTNKSFHRSDMVIVSDSALEAAYKGGDETLLEKLIGAGAVTVAEPEPEPGITVTEGPDGLVIEVTNQAGLVEAVNQTEKVAEINITESFTVSEDSGISFEGDKLELYANVVMTVAEDVTLTVVEGGQLGVYWFTYDGDWETGTIPDGKLINNGTIILETDGWINGEFTRNSGTVLVKDGGQCQTMPNYNSGTVTVESGGSYRTTQGQEAMNVGTVTIAEGANMVARFGSTIDNRGSLTMDGLLSVGYVYLPPQGDMQEGHEELWFRNSGEVTGTGTARVFEAMNEESESAYGDRMLALMYEALGSDTTLTVVTGIGTGV